MKWVGLTGGLGTGKSTVSRLLIKNGVPVIDADRIARQVLDPGEPAYHSVVQSFGPEVLTADKAIDRKVLAQKVFGQPAELEKLERLIHPFVQEEVKRQRQWLQDQGTLWAVYDVPLLFEKNLRDQFDYVIVVTATVQQQIDRVKLRNSWTEDEIMRRIQSQKPLKEKETQADYILRNDTDELTLEKSVASLVQMLNDFFNEEGK